MPPGVERGTGSATQGPAFSLPRPSHPTPLHFCVSRRGGVRVLSMGGFFLLSTSSGPSPTVKTSWEDPRPTNRTAVEGPQWPVLGFMT